MPKNPFKSTDKVAIMYTHRGEVKRTRFHKGTSTQILQRKKETLGGEFITKKGWIRRTGEKVDPQKTPLTTYVDIRFTHLTDKEREEIIRRKWKR